MKMRERLMCQFAGFSPINMLMLLAAGIVNAVGVTIFIAPVNLYDSGISGTSILLGQLTPPQFSLTLFLLLLNIPLLLFGLKRQGPLFTLYAIFAVGVYAGTAWLITDVLPVDVRLASPLAGTDLFLCAIFGGMISGVGSGLAIRYGGAMDGMEVVAVVFAKRLGVTVGTFMMAYNAILYILCGVILKSWILPLYSIVTYASSSKTVDFIVDGLDTAKAAMIITERPKEVGDELSSRFEIGLTVWDARGYYSGKGKTMLYAVVNQFQIPRLKEAVHKLDPNAYVTITTVADLLHGSMEQERQRKREGKNGMEIREASLEGGELLELFSEHDEYMMEFLGEHRKYYTPYSKAENLSRAWIAYVDGEPAGCAAYRAGDEGVGELKRVFVRPRYRGRGISKELVRTVEGCAIGQGCHTLALDTNSALEPAVTIYRRTGFRVVFREGEYIKMEKELGPNDQSRA